MIKSYLINLPQDAERLAFFAANFRRLYIDFERIPAIDGRLSGETEYQAFMRARPRHNKGWLRGQMGCFLSHYAVWEKIARSEQRFGAVFEDDVHVSDDLSLILADDLWIPDNVDLIRLETSTNRLRLGRQPVLQCAGRPLFAVQSTSWCAGAYLMHRRTAQRLLDLPMTAHEPADAMLYHFADSALARQLNILQFNPAPCTQDKHLLKGSQRFASNIESAAAPAGRWTQLSPLAVARGVCRTLRGYQRIAFA